MSVYQYDDVTKSLEDWLADRDQNLFYEESQVKVGGLDGVRRTIKDGDQEIIKTYVKNGENAYEIRLEAQDEVLRNQYFSIVDYFETSFVAEEPADDEVTEDVITDEEALDEETDKTPTEDETTAEEETTAPEDTTTTAEEQGEVMHEMEPLTDDQVARVIEKGFSPFQGRTLSFEYPKVWYFSYLGNGIYGFTDDETYKAAAEEITQKNSRLLVESGDLTVSCSYQQEQEVNDVTYTVCAREPGLKEVVDHIANSITAGSGD